MEEQFSLKDIAIAPDNMRGYVPYYEIDIHYHDTKLNDILSDWKHLPLFAASLDTSVINEKNYDDFERCGIKTVIPESVSTEERMVLCKTVFCAFSLRDARALFLDETPLGYGKMDGFRNLYVSMDVEHGNARDVYELCKELREKYGDGMTIMVGGVTDHRAYLSAIVDYENCVDYIRIGGGDLMFETAMRTGVYYPIGSLISKCHGVKWVNKTHACPKIVADCGISCSEDIVKALALGADYVMLGSSVVKQDKMRYANYVYNRYTNEVKGEYEYNSVSGWTYLFSLDLRNAMGLVGRSSLGEFIGNVKIHRITQNARISAWC